MAVCQCECKLVTLNLAPNKTSLANTDFARGALCCAVTGWETIIQPGSFFITVEGSYKKTSVSMSLVRDIILVRIIGINWSLAEVPQPIRMKPNSTSSSPEDCVVL